MVECGACTAPAESADAVECGACQQGLTSVISVCKQQIHTSGSGSVGALTTRGKGSRSMVSGLYCSPHSRLVKRMSSQIHAYSSADGSSYQETLTN